MNVLSAIKSPIFGGQVLGSKNPLKEQVRQIKLNKFSNGAYYILKNVQKALNEPEFFDIWILIESIKNKEQHLKLQSLQELGDLNITFWHKEMLYPFDHKFILFDDIADCMTGYARIVEFRCFKTGHDGFADPSADGAYLQNWILSISEGQYKNGRENGFSRQINAYNGYCRIGYYKDGEPWGKWCEFQPEGKQWSQEGIYAGTNKLVKKQKIMDFLENEEPGKYMQLTGDKLIEIEFEK